MTISINGTSGIVNDATDLNYTGTLTGGTGVVNLGSGQVYKDASGNVVFGATSATYSAAGRVSVEVNGATDSVFAARTGGTARAYIQATSTQVNLYTASAIPLTLGTDNNERARIDSSGNLLVGTTAAVGGERLNVTQSSNNHNVRIINSVGSGNVYGPLFNFSGLSPNNTTSQFLICSDSTTTRALIYSNGGIANYSANNVNLSDRLEKMNFAPAGSYLDKICAIPVQTYNYISQNLEEDADLTLGVVAQDVQAVAPELVTEGNWGTEEDPKIRLSIYQTDLQYALMKCIQEQQTLITALTARITALEQA